MSERTCTECGRPDDEGLCHDCWAEAHKFIGTDEEDLCPLCGGWLTDIRGERGADGVGWVCRESGDSPVARRHGRPGCGARGRYDERGRPVANEADAARLDGMYGRLVEALALATDPPKARCLADRYALLRLMEVQLAWTEDAEGRLLWCADAATFEEEMGQAEEDLARRDFSDHTGSHLACCGDGLPDGPEPA